MTLVIFLCAAVGIYWILTARFPGIYPPAAAALRRRGPKQLSQTDILINAAASRIARHIDIEPIKRLQLADTLRSLGHDETPELYRARAMARALLLSAACFWLVLISPVVGIAGMAILFAALYSGQDKQLQREVDERRQRIERELPQFASTVRQSLSTSRDVVGILTSYKKVCGHALRIEIERTINDMVTGNPERAIKALESRVASAKFGQLTRGLIAVLRGDDQRIYFDMIAAEYRKAQNEEVAKALLRQPEKLMPHMGLLFVCLVLMICASLGTYLAQQMGTFF